MIFKPRLLCRSSNALQHQKVPQLHVKNTPTLPNLPQKSIYNHLFSQLKSPPNLQAARKLHALLIQNGCFHPTCDDKTLGSQLINIYVKFGSFDEAFNTFTKLPNKNSIAWNAILRGLVDMCHFSEAIEFFYNSMLLQGIIPDNYTYPIVLKACSGLYDIEQGKKVVNLIKFNETRYNVKSNVFVECAIIDMFAKCGSLVNARVLFEEMPIRDLASWTMMINACAKNGEWLEALSMFSRMRFEGLKPDSVIIASIIPAFGRSECKLIGMALEGYVLKSGFKNDLYVSNALIDMYCKLGDTREARRKFCEMECKDEVSWSTMISGYNQNFCYGESIELYLTMKDFGLGTNAVMATSVVQGFGKLKLITQGKEMHNYVIKQGFESDIVLGNALIDMYANCGLTREAEHVFEIMLDKDISIWNSMIAGHALNGDMYSSFGIFQRIWETKLIPNHITLIVILPLCTKMGNLKHGKEIHGYAMRTGLETVVCVGNSIIDMYCKCGYLGLGVKVFENMLEKNMVTYNTFISAHGLHGLGHQAFSYFSQMLEARINPNKVTFGALLSACSHAGLVTKGWSFYNSMINDYGILPEIEHYSCMVDLLGRSGNLIDACKFIRKMAVEPDMNIWGSLLGACRAHNMAELAELVEKQIPGNFFDDPGYYVILANIYASTEKWRDSSKIRAMIKEKGLIKKPGSSWIQIGLCIHMFHAGSEMHSEFDRIKAILENLVLEMKADGPEFFLHDLTSDDR